MLKIAFLGGKGGITKTALARATATQLQKRQFNPIGFDTDGDQASFWRWMQRRKDTQPDLSTFPVVTGSVATTIEKQTSQTNFDAAVIDGAAYASRFVKDIARFVDLVVLPTRFSVDDLESTVRIYNELTRAGIPNNRLAVAFSGVSESKKEHREARSLLEGMGIYVLEGYVPQMLSYSTAQDNGLSICEVKNQPRLFTLARWMVDAIIDRALQVKEPSKK